MGGLPKNLSDDKLEEYFSRYGFVQKCYVVKDAFTGKTRGFGFVIFGTQEGFEGVLNAPDHFIEGQEIHIKPAQARDDEQGEDGPEEIPRGREQNKKKQVRQSKMNLPYQSESFSPNARNHRGNPKRGSENYYQYTSGYDDGNSYPNSYGLGHDSEQDFFRGNMGYSPDASYGNQQHSRGGNKQGNYSMTHAAANHGSHQHQNLRKPQNFSSYQESVYMNSPLTYESSQSYQQHYARNQYQDHLISPTSAKRNPRAERTHLDNDQRPPQNAVANSLSYSPKSRQATAESFSRNESQFMKPTKVTDAEHELQQVQFPPSLNDGFPQPYSLPGNPQDSQGSVQQSPIYQSSPLNNRSPGGFHNPVRSANKHFSGLQQIPENESQKLSGEHVSQSTNRVNHNSNHNQVLQSNQGSQLEDDLAQESDNLIEDFNFFGQPLNASDPPQKVSPSNPPDSLRLQSRNQLSNPINFPQAGDSLMSASRQYASANLQNGGRFIASSSNVILHQGMSRPDPIDNNQTVKPQFSHKQIIQSSQKQGYSMFSPIPTPLAPGFQRSNDGGSGTQIRKGANLHSDRTISNEDMFKKQGIQLSPDQQAAKLHYYAGNMHYAAPGGMQNMADPRSPVHQQNPVLAYSPPNGGQPDQHGHPVRAPFSNAIYTRINNPAKVSHRSEQAIGHSQSYNVWSAQQQQNNPVYSQNQPPGSTPFVDKHTAQNRRNHLDGNVCIPIDEDGDYDDKELQKATDF